jgi:hypothetical protein
MFAVDFRRPDRPPAQQRNVPAPEAPAWRPTSDGQSLLLMVALYVMALIGGAVLLRVLTPVSNDPTLIVTAADSQSR